MSIVQELTDAKKFSVKARIIWDWYQSRRASDEWEPNWIHPAYEWARKVVNGEKLTNDERRWAHQVVGSHRTPDHTVVETIFGQRTIHDGVSVGTTSWIFLGRNDATPEEHGGWVVISRSYKGWTAWMAYHRDLQMGLSAMTGQEIGPCGSKAEILSLVVGMQKQTH